MKRVLVKQAPITLAVKKRDGTKKKVRALRPLMNCTRPGCTNTLAPSQKKYCSHSCRNIVLKGGNGGGLSKYEPKFAGQLFLDYLEWCEKGQEPTLIPTESSYIVIHNAQMPSNEGYAEWLERSGHIKKIHIHSLQRWADTYEDFTHVLDRIKRIQKIWLLNNGLSGRYNSNMSKLALGVNHGMIERHEVDNTHKLIGVVKLVYQRADEIDRERYGKN
jgi:hypothetical protein